MDEVREMIAEELEQEGTSPQEYLRFHCNALKDEHLKKVFGVEDHSQLTNAVFLKALKLGHVGIFPASPSAIALIHAGLALHRRSPGGVSGRGRRGRRRDPLGILKQKTKTKNNKL